MLKNHLSRAHLRGQLVCLLSLATLVSLSAQPTKDSDSNDASPMKETGPSMNNPTASTKGKKFSEPGAVDSQLTGSSFTELLAKAMGGNDPSKDHIKTLLTGNELEHRNASDGPLSTIDLLTRSGFSYELHDSVSLDGYVTQLVRIVNPLAKRDHLRREPVVLYAGQGASPAVFLMTQVGQYKPLQWPASSDSDSNDWLAGGHRSANRSLAITLANSGYDVWLVPARGVDKTNRGRIPRPPQSDKIELLKRFLASMKGKLADAGAKNKSSTTATTTMESFLSDHRAEMSKFWNEFDAQNYWSFSSDDIVKNEFECQLNVVLKRTNCQKVSLVTYSNGGFIAFAFMAEQHAYASEHIGALVSIAPAVFINKFNLILGLGGLLSRLNPPNWPMPEDHIDEMARKSFTCMCKSKLIRYSMCKLALNQLYGHSDMFKTFLELSVLDYIGRPMSGQGLRQSLQVAYCGQLRHYDYGSAGNMIVYNSSQPPAYNLSSIKCPRHLLVTGDRDAIVDEVSAGKLVQELSSKPNQWVNIPGYNHLDLLAGHDSAERVNAPVLEFLGDLHMEANYYHEKGGKFAQNGNKNKDNNTNTTTSEEVEEEEEEKDEFEVDLSGGSEESEGDASKARSLFLHLPSSVMDTQQSGPAEPEAKATNRSQPPVAQVKPPL